MDWLMQKGEQQQQVTYACQKPIEPLQSGIMGHAHHVNHLINFPLYR